MAAERGKWKFLCNAKFASTKAPLDLDLDFRLNLSNCKKNNKIQKQILNFLPNLWETLIEVQSFHSICLKIGVKVKRSTL